MAERLRVLAVDVGTGTQDILFFESDRTIENCYQFVLPSPTVIVAERIRRATEAGATLLLTGRTMGGGPSAWAARDHALAGLPAFATPDAARTLDDDLSVVEGMGLHIVDATAAARLVAENGEHVVHVVLRDFDAAALRSTLATYGVDPRVDVVAVAAFDHGAAPPGYSDRRFRFDYIRRAVAARPEPVAFAYRRADIPAELTRLAAVADDAAQYQHSGGAQDGGHEPLVVVMDTGSAAVAGALDDAQVRAAGEIVVANVGNFHTLAFHLRDGSILGLFEHHTGELTRQKLEGYLRGLVDGTLSNDAIFGDSGHGALLLDGRVNAEGAGGEAEHMPLVAVTGPRRELLRDSALGIYEAVPHGDMMLAGCFGLLRAVAACHPDLAPAIENVLGPPLVAANAAGWAK